MNPRHPTLGSMPGARARGQIARGQNLEPFKLLYFKFFSGVHILTATRTKGNVESFMRSDPDEELKVNLVQLLRIEFLKFL